MVSKASKNRSVESVLSVILLFSLALTALGILILQSNADISRFGMTATNADSLPQPSYKSILDSVLPEDFTAQSEVETYNADNLYEKIDGKAPLYIDSGFVELTAQRFISKKDENLWMEIELFDMANPRNAFSIFSVQRRAEVIASKNLDPQYEYGTENAIFLRIGQYYIEMVGSAKSEKLLQAMTEIAQNLKKKLPVDAVTDIAELGLFPEKDIVAGSQKLYLANAFGFDGFTDVFVGRYKINDMTITAYLGEYKDEQAAKAKADSYYKFLIENGAKDKTAFSDILKNNKIKVVDFYDTTEIVFATGRFIGGIHEANNQQAAETLAGRLFEKLSEQAATR